MDSYGLPKSAESLSPSNLDLSAIIRLTYRKGKQSEGLSGQNRIVGCEVIEPDPFIADPDRTRRNVVGDVSLCPELSTLGLGLGHKTVSSSSVAKPVMVATVSEPEIEVDPVIAALRRVKRPVTNDELAAILGVTKGTASHKVAALNGVIRKDRVGREVAISLARRLN